MRWSQRLTGQKTDFYDFIISFHCHARFRQARLSLFSLGGDARFRYLEAIEFSASQTVCG